MLGKELVGARSAPFKQICRQTVFNCPGLKVKGNMLDEYLFRVHGNNTGFPQNISNSGICPPRLVYIKLNFAIGNVYIS